MGSLFILLMIGGIFWLAVGRPRFVGRASGRRVYLRQGPGVWGILLSVVLVLALASHMKQVLILLLIGCSVFGICIGALRRANRLPRDRN